VSVVCGTTAGAADSKISNQPITFKSNRNRLIQIQIESRSFTGLYTKSCPTKFVQQAKMQNRENLSKKKQRTKYFYSVCSCIQAKVLLLELQNYMQDQTLLKSTVVVTC